MDRISTQDRAIERANDDRLDRIPFVDNLIKALVIEERDVTGKTIARHSTGVVVGLVGKWGLGKSSILNLLAERLRKLDHVAVATLNPWLFKGREELLTAFFNELRDALGKNLKEHGHDVLEALDKYQWAINGAAHVGALALDAHGAGGAATITVKKYLKKLKDFKAKKPTVLSPQEERRSLEAKLKAKNIAVVVLIDELDRVEDEEVRAVAQLVKAVGDIKGISYLVAYDPKRVAEALGREPDRQRSGAAYLEKIIQHPIPLRPLFPEDVEELITFAMEQQGAELPSVMSENEEAILQHIKEAITTPREIKRLAGSYGILEPMVRGEVCEVDILAYCWLITKSEPLREALMTHYDHVVDDPPAAVSYTRHITRESGRLDPTATLGTSAEEFDQILRLLFPAFGTSREGEPGSRISRRRNLIRLLYLGNPPGMMHRTALEALWDNHNIEDLAATLRDMFENGTLSSLLDRLDELLPTLHPKGDRTFWPALSRVLMRSTDWAHGASPNGPLAEDAATYLMRFGARGNVNADRMKEALVALEQDGDLIIAPWVLRKHLFAFGLTKHRKDRGGTSALSESETLGMLAREMPRYRTALVNGTLIKRVPNLEAIFVIDNMQHWDASLREALTTQMSDARARATLAALVVPPGYSTVREHLDNLMDAEKVLAWMEAAGEGRGPRETWLDLCLARLRRVLEGKDLIAWDDTDD
jgi:hypothetical protein